MQRPAKGPYGKPQIEGNARTGALRSSLFAVWLGNSRECALWIAEADAGWVLDSYRRSGLTVLEGNGGDHGGRRAGRLEPQQALNSLAWYCWPSWAKSLVILSATPR